MTSEEFSARVKELIPTATLAADNDGQVIIYTDLVIVDGNMVPYDPESANDSI